MTLITPPPAAVAPNAPFFPSPVSRVPSIPSIPASPSARQKLDDMLRGAFGDEGTGFAPTNTEGAGKFISDPPPFEGGQSVGVLYKAALKMTYSDAPTRYYLAGGGFGTESPISDSDVRIGGIPIEGAFSGELTTSQNNAISLSAYYKGNNFGNLMYVFGSNPKVSVYKVVRADGQPDTGGNVATPGNRVQQGYNGDTSRNKSPSPPPIIPPSFSPAVGWGTGRGVSPDAVRPALGIGKEPNTGKSPTTTPERKAPPPSPNPSTRPTPTPSPQPPSPTPSEKPKSPVPNNPEIPSDNRSIMQKLLELGGILAIIAAATQFDALKNAAKQGSCETMKSPSCTKDMEDRIKDPINQNVNDKTSLLNTSLSGVNTALSGFIAATTTNFGKILNLLDNTIVDRAIGVANFAMNVHNALMLSNALGRTLAGVVDTAMGLTPFRFTDSNGNNTTASRAFSSNVSALIVNLIGQDLYTELSDDWKVANRIYQSTTNALNKTERLLAGQSKVAQKSGIEVANIGNALRANGIVNPNSYPPMAATKEANTPSELLTDVNTPLSSIQSGIKNLNTITKSVSGTLKQVSAIQKEFGKLQDLTNKESKIRKSLRTQSAAEAKRKAKFTLLQIKTIRQTGKK